MRGLTACASTASDKTSASKAFIVASAQSGRKLRSAQRGRVRSWQLAGRNGWQSGCVVRLNRQNTTNASTPDWFARISNQKAKTHLLQGRGCRGGHENAGTGSVSTAINHKTDFSCGAALRIFQSMKCRKITFNRKKNTHKVNRRSQNAISSLRYASFELRKLHQWLRYYIPDGVPESNESHSRENR